MGSFVCSSCGEPLNHVSVGDNVEVSPCTNCVEQIIRENVDRLKNEIQSVLLNFSEDVEV